MIRTTGTLCSNCDKVIPALSKGKFNINATDVTDEIIKKFMAKWRKETVDVEKDNATKKKVAETISPLIKNWTAKPVPPGRRQEIIMKKFLEKLAHLESAVAE